MNCTAWHDTDASSDDSERLGDLGSVVWVNAQIYTMCAWLSVDFFMSPFRERSDWCTILGTIKTHGS